MGKVEKNVYIKICGLDSSIKAVDATLYSSLEDFADTDVYEKTEFFEIEPYFVDYDVLENALKLEEIISENATIKDVKVLRAISYDAENADEYQELIICFDENVIKNL